MNYLGGGGAIFILNNLVIDWGTHADSSARIVRVKVLSLSVINKRECSRDHKNNQNIEIKE